MRHLLLSVFVALIGSFASAAQATPIKGRTPITKTVVKALVPTKLAPRKVQAVSVEASTTVAQTELRRGRVSIASGPLAGAVVQLPNSEQRVVTNANGEFQLVVPASSGPLRATVTYAGFADEEALLLPGQGTYTVIMTTAQPIEVEKQYQLKAYERTAMKEVNRSLREVRKSM